MRGTLNNPWIVGALCVAAVGVVCWQWLPAWLMESGPTPISDDVRAMVAPIVNTETEQLVAKVLERGQWVTSFSRDPFQPISTIGQGAEGKRDDGSTASHHPTGSLSLQAVTVGGSRRLAVINQAIVSEGAQVEGYQVVRIESRSVILEDHDGRQRLTFRDKGSDDEQ